MWGGVAVAQSSMPLEPEISIAVKGSVVNLRAGAGLDFEVVRQVDRGHPLVACRFEGDWVEVVPPEGSSVWVHRRYVEDGRVSASELNVRAGPGENYTVICRVPRGTMVERIGEHHEWMEIVPLPGCTFWINQEYVEPVLPIRAEEEPVPPPEPDEAPMLPESPPNPLPEPGLQPPPIELVPLDGQGDRAVVEGELRITDRLFGRPTPFRLVRGAGTGGRREMICYVHGNKKQLHSLLHRDLRVEGRKYWAKDVEYPIVVPEKIVIKRNDE